MNLCRSCENFDAMRRTCSVMPDGFFGHDVSNCAGYNRTAPDQTAKQDAGKLQLTLTPTQIIRDIAEVRMYGNKKYGSADNWKTVSPQRFRDAFFRHWLAYVDDPKSLDAESGLPHLWHAACNLAFLCEMEVTESEEQT